jgi:hypothetical protein
MYENVNTDKFLGTNKTLLKSIINFFTEDSWAFVILEKRSNLSLSFQGNYGRWSCGRFIWCLLEVMDNEYPARYRTYCS